MDAPSPARSLGRAAALYLGVALAACGTLTAGLRLSCADLTAPFEYTADALLILPLVKETVEGGTRWRTERLGAPGVQELYDFPIVDYLHFAAIRALGWVWPDPVAAFNLFYLLTYPLAAVTGTWAARRVGLSPPAAGAVGLLFAFQPYHYLRGEAHYFLSAYYVVPLSLVPALDVCRGRLPFFASDPVGGRRFRPLSRAGLGAVVIGALTATAGAYYAFFGCAFLAAAGLYGWAEHRTWRAPASAALVVGVVVAGGVLGHLPTVLYQAEHGRNSAATARPSLEAEYYGLKPATLVLPVPGHQVDLLADVRHGYDLPGRPLQHENRTATLGVVGAAGLLGLLAALARPARGWPTRALAALTLFGLLLGTVGGLGALFAELVSPQVRAYSRVSIFLAFLALLAVGFALDSWLVHRPAWVRGAAFLAVAAVGVADQCGRPWFRREAVEERDAVAARWHADAAYYAGIEADLPGGMAFTLPYLRYPENDQPGTRVEPYQSVRGYLHTRTVRWSFGAMKRREADQWQREVSTAPPAGMVRRLAVRGFDALLIDRRGYAPDQAQALTFAVARELGGPPRWVHPDGDPVAFDLRPYRDRIRERLGPAFDAERTADEERVRVLWLHGFDEPAEPGHDNRHRWCDRVGEAVFVNPSPRPKVVDLRMVLRTDWDRPADLTIRGVWEDRLAIHRASPVYARTVTVPPGRHVVRFRCRRPSDAPRPAGGWNQVFFVALFEMTERETGP